MQPKIIKLNKRYITGMFGNIETQGEVWAKVNECYAKNPFAKSDEHFCHVYLWDTANPEKSVFFGYETESTIKNDDFVTIEIPACEWAIFEFGPLKWDSPDSGSVIDWIENNEKYRCGKYDGSIYQLEYHKQKLKEGKDFEACMEVWYPLEEKGK